MENEIKKASDQINSVNRIYIFISRYLIFIIALIIFFLFILNSDGSFFGIFWDELFRFVVVAFVAWLVSTLLQLLLKKPRPYESGKEAMMKPWIQTPSFPSSHAAISFALASYAFLIDWSPLGVMLVVLALIVSVGRVVTGCHYIRDVVAGAVLGILVAAGGIYLFYFTNCYFCAF